jgi:hypothetical protein
VRGGTSWRRPRRRAPRSCPSQATRPRPSPCLSLPPRWPPPPPLLLRLQLRRSGKERPARHQSSKFTTKTKTPPNPSSIPSNWSTRRGRASRTHRGHRGVRVVRRGGARVVHGERHRRAEGRPRRRRRHEVLHRRTQAKETLVRTRRRRPLPPRGPEVPSKKKKQSFTCAGQA